MDVVLSASLLASPGPQDKETCNPRRALGASTIMGTRTRMFHGPLFLAFSLIRTSIALPRYRNKLFDLIVTLSPFQRQWYHFSRYVVPQSILPTYFILFFSCPMSLLYLYLVEWYTVFFFFSLRVLTINSWFSLC